MFDRSGSMDEDPGVDGFSTRIDLARAAIASLLQAYDSVADVNILIVDFAGAGSEYPGLDVAANSGWLTSLDERSEEHTSELQSLMRISYAVFSLKKKKY